MKIYFSTTRNSTLLDKPDDYIVNENQVTRAYRRNIKAVAQTNNHKRVNIIYIDKLLF